MTLMAIGVVVMATAKDLDGYEQNNLKLINHTKEDIDGMKSR